jgi:hypothetical protein
MFILPVSNALPAFGEGRHDRQTHQAIDGGKRSAVNVVGTYPARQQTLVGSFGEGPAVKVLKGIREEFEKLPDESAKRDATSQPASSGVAPLNEPSPHRLFRHQQTDS